MSTLNPFNWAAKDLPGEASKGPSIPLPVPDPRERMMRWFDASHLPPELQGAVQPFNVLAGWMLRAIPPGPEAIAAMRHLLEAKDAAVRGFIEGIEKEKKSKPA
jgi:hypothetical protein